MANNYEILIKLAADLQEGKDAAEVVKQLDKVTKDLTASTVTATKATEKAAAATATATKELAKNEAKTKDVKDALQGLGAEFPEVAQLARLALNPVSGFAAAAALAFSQAIERIKELDAAFDDFAANQGFEKAMDSRLAKIEAINRALGNHREELKRIEQATPSISDQQADIVKQMRETVAFRDQANEQQRKAQIGAIDRAERGGKLTPAQADAARGKVDSEFTRAKAARHAQLELDEGTVRSSVQEARSKQQAELEKRAQAAAERLKSMPSEGEIDEERGAARRKLKAEQDELKRRREATYRYQLGNDAEFSENANLPAYDPRRLNAKGIVSQGDYPKVQANVKALQDAEQQQRDTVERAQRLIDRLNEKAAGRKVAADAAQRTFSDVTAAAEANRRAQIADQGSAPREARDQIRREIGNNNQTASALADQNASLSQNNLAASIIATNARTIRLLEAQTRRLFILEQRMFGLAR